MESLGKDNGFINKKCLLGKLKVKPRELTGQSEQYHPIAEIPDF